MLCVPQTPPKPYYNGFRASHPPVTSVKKRSGWVPRAGESVLDCRNLLLPSPNSSLPSQSFWNAPLIAPTLLGREGLPGGWGFCKDFCCELSPILQSCLPLVCFPEALSWGFWTVPSRAASSLPLGMSGATTIQMTEIISLVSKLLSKLNILPFHKNKVDALRFLRNKSGFRNVLQTGKLDFTTLKKCNKFLVPVLVQIAPLSISHAEHYLISSGVVKAGETVGIRVSSLRAGSHSGLSDIISVYFVTPGTCFGVAATGGAERFSALCCYRHSLFPGWVNASLF